MLNFVFPVIGFISILMVLIFGFLLMLGLCKAAGDADRLAEKQMLEREEKKRNIEESIHSDLEFKEVL